MATIYSPNKKKIILYVTYGHILSTLTGTYS